jgi:hypothetical protein
VSWNGSTPELIVPICPINVTDCSATGTSRDGKVRLGQGAVDGIIIGGILAILLLTLLTWFFLIRPRRQQSMDNKGRESPIGKPELDGSAEVVNANHKSGSDSAVLEIDGAESQGLELHGESTPMYELYGDDPQYPEMGVHR